MGLVQETQEMNIFILDTDPVIAAQYQCDKHVVKMVLESAQLLCGLYADYTDAPYKRTHYNHPCAIWARASKENYLWLLDHAYGLVDEYAYRYKRQHKCEQVIDYCNTHQAILSFPQVERTPFAQAMPDIYKNTDPVIAYRNYYMGAKKDIAKWNKNREKPVWFIP